MDFDAWRSELFESTYPSLNIGQVCIASTRPSKVSISWGAYRRSVDLSYIYDESSKNNPVNDVMHWVYLNFPVQSKIEKNDSFLYYNPMLRCYDSYVVRSESVTHVMHNIDPKDWNTRKSVDDFGDVIDYSLKGSLVQIKPLGTVPAASVLSYPYVMQEMVEEHLDYSGDYRVARPVFEDGCVYIGHQRSIARLVEQSEDETFHDLTLKGALKEHYEHIR